MSTNESTANEKTAVQSERRDGDRLLSVQNAKTMTRGWPSQRLLRDLPSTFASLLKKPIIIQQNWLPYISPNGRGITTNAPSF
jgi:hypothetical protein